MIFERFVESICTQIVSASAFVYMVAPTAYAVSLATYLTKGYDTCTHYYSNTIATLGSIAIAVVIYGVLVVSLRCISREDLSLMPKGDKIARLLRL